MKALALKLLNHLRYPTTWFGLIGLVSTLGLTLTDVQVEAVAGAAAAVASAVIAIIGVSDSDVEDKE
jgi:hypothetical protein